MRQKVCRYHVHGLDVLKNGERLLFPTNESNVLRYDLAFFLMPQTFRGQHAYFYPLTTPTNIITCTPPAGPTMDQTPLFNQITEITACGYAAAAAQ